MLDAERSPGRSTCQGYVVVDPSWRGYARRGGAVKDEPRRFLAKYGQPDPRRRAEGGASCRWRLGDSFDKPTRMEDYHGTRDRG